ncbi:hypothetical protein [Clostridium sp. BJN0001]|uniref:hypothetical protein n=1 Tax=Clostridium sp. BJN0001 TaxID=2930219 RepID=UPI001FCFA8D2|nr:hypothetical protein [Clostridium sp. BJN0001]
MRKKDHEIFLIGISLVIISLFLHYVHYLIFKDAHHTLIFLTSDIAFIPLDVFFTSIILDKLIEKREKKHIIESNTKLIGVFFAEVGNSLISLFNKYNKESIKSSSCSLSLDDEFKSIKQYIEICEFKITLKSELINKLYDMLDENKYLLLILSSSSNVILDESFLEMIITFLHLQGEIRDADKLDNLQRDIDSSYKKLCLEWVKYMEGIKERDKDIFTKKFNANPFIN